MAVWIWLQPVDRIWKVITDPEKGAVNVYNEREELVMERKDLKKEDVLLIEENFFNVVATRLTDKKPGDIAELKKSISGYNPMYV